MDRFSHARRRPSAATLTSSPSSSRPALLRRSDTAPGEDLSSAVADALRHPGQPLDASSRDAAERRLGFDFSHVRIHTDESAAASARALHAHAYTLGPHIVFGSGDYAPDTEAGRHRLDHELSHFMQQRPGSPMPEGSLRLGSPDSVHERQAHQMARAASPAEAHSLLSATGPLHPAVVARDSKPGAPETVQEERPSPDVAERQARNAYPNNPRAAELQKKMILGTITQPEMSELRGIASFPDNPRAAALYAKQDAGTITPAEQEELGGYFSRLAALDGGLESPDRQLENPRAAALRAKQAAGSLSRQEQAELQGLNGYPDNPRAAALYTKQVLGKLTKKERAELQGFNAYPNNRRAAALYTKQVIRKLTKKESAELQGFSAYPDNPRAAALSAKQTLGTITKTESAELQGFVLHPYNRSAAALRAKVLLGEQLTMDERGELSDESYYQAMGEFLIRLERKAREGRLRDKDEAQIYEKLRNDPKVLRRAALIRQSGHDVISPFD